MDFNKPRIALWYYVIPQTGMRNDGACLYMNYNFRKLLDSQDALFDPKVMQHQGNVHHFQPNMPTHMYGNFDLHLLVDHGEDGIGAPLDFKLPHPNAYWIADSHISGESYKYRLNRAKEFDFVFASHKPSIEQFEKDGLKVRYMPWAAETAVYRPIPIIEKYDWCFIGHLNNQSRIDLVDRFCREWLVGEKGYLGWRKAEIPGYNVFDDAAKKICQSRIVLNESISTDLNMRTPETLACRRLLLTERVPAVEEFFIDGEDLVLFSTIDEAVEKAKYYLANEQERSRIAENGYQKFLKGWTYKQRAETILDVCLPSWRASCPNVQAYAPEYDLRGSLIPSSAIDCRLLSHSDGEQSRAVKEVVPSV